MGIFENLGNLLKGHGKTTLPVQLEPGEIELQRCIASGRPGTLFSMGGELVVTNRRIVFTPWNTRDLSAVLSWGLKKAGAPAGTAGIPTYLDERIQQQEAREVVAVTAGSNGSAKKPPTIFIQTRDGSRLEVGILAGMAYPNFHPANRRKRDEVLTAIQADLQ